MASTSAQSQRPTLAAPTWLSRFLGQFPLYTHPAATGSTSGSAPSTAQAAQPTLYAVPPHPTLASSWASADPRCLRWQMELLFRSNSSGNGGQGGGAAQPSQFRVAFLDPRAEDFVWGPGGTLPFLQLPLAFDGRNPSGTLVGVAGLQHWADNYRPYAWDRPELDEKAAASGPRCRPYADTALHLEAQSWVTLLETKALAGVLIQLLLLPSVPARPTQRPALLTRLLASSLLPSALYRLSLLRKLSYLVPLHPTSHPSPLPAFLAWLGAVEFTHPFSIPGGSDPEKDAAANLGKSELEREEDIGDRARAGDWRSCRTERDESVLLERALREGTGTYVDLLRDACEAIEAIGARLEADGPEADQRWALNAEAPAPLDALLFSVLHTVLSLPVDRTLTSHAGAAADAAAEPSEDDDPAYTIKAPARSLREAIERHPVLLRWTRRVWAEWVKPSKLFTVDGVA